MFLWMQGWQNCFERYNMTVITPVTLPYGNIQIICMSSAAYIIYNDGTRDKHHISNFDIMTHLSSVCRTAAYRWCPSSLFIIVQRICHSPCRRSDAAAGQNTKSFTWRTRRCRGVKVSGSTASRRAFIPPASDICISAPEFDAPFAWNRMPIAVRCITGETSKNL